MEIIGRVTADAQVAETKSGKQVVNFTVAVNETYKPKDGERKVITDYFKCSYWRSAAVAKYLEKGTIVHVTGRIGVDAYMGRDGKAKGQLTVRVQRVEWFKASGSTKATGPVIATESVEDLPF